MSCMVATYRFRFRQLPLHPVQDLHVRFINHEYEHCRWKLAQFSALLRPPLATPRHTAPVVFSLQLLLSVLALE